MNMIPLAFPSASSQPPHPSHTLGPWRREESTGVTPLLTQGACGKDGPEQKLPDKREGIDLSSRQGQPQLPDGFITPRFPNIPFE